MVPVRVGDVIEYRNLAGDQEEMVVLHVETGTAHGCLYVGDADSVWDWQVVRVLRKKSSEEG